MSERHVRRDDDEGSVEYRKRQLIMPADGPSLLVNGSLGRARVVISMVKELGVTTIMLGFFVGWTAGWIPSPLTSLNALEAAQTQAIKDLAKAIYQHDENRGALVRSLVTSWRVLCENTAKTRTDFNNCEHIEADLLSKEGRRAHTFEDH